MEANKKILMEANEKVAVECSTVTADASPTILFTFTMLTMMFLALGTGYLSGSALLLLGCIQIGVYPVYIYCATNAISRKDPISGNCFLIFASLFGGAAGLCNLASYFAGIFDWPVDGRIMGIVWIWSGLMLVPIVAAMRKGPSLPVAVFSSAAVMLVLFGVSSLGYFSEVLSPIVLVLQAFVGIGGFYICLASLFSMAEISLPLGKPFF